MSPASPHGEHFAEVVVVRHGETSWNTSRVIQVCFYSLLVHLLHLQSVSKTRNISPYFVVVLCGSDLSSLKTLKLARRLCKEAKPVSVYSSDLKRAAETAQTIATACDVSNLVFDQALRERHMGDLHGLKFDDAYRIKPEAYKAFSSGDRSEEIPGGGESLDQLSERCVSCLNAIAEKHKGERVIVVSHGATIEEICRHANPTSSARRRIPNTSISVIHISGDNHHWILEKLGDVAHLMASCRAHSAAMAPLRKRNRLFAARQEEKMLFGVHGFMRQYSWRLKHASVPPLLQCSHLSPH
ncbi:hypothetical protein HU200_030759 [Digitaria exilis]|uniref:Phosphoglycerate mutase n=1 Tax=Digitaria exilis TaxID=1010633 RepID=A0A835C2T2_9POAL|nr:hypothetical protein HU200_030759 [Digitaria exilis]